jgi:hypothetical protein
VTCAALARFRASPPTALRKRLLLAWLLFPKTAQPLNFLPILTACNADISLLKKPPTPPSTPYLPAIFMMRPFKKFFGNIEWFSASTVNFFCEVSIVRL